MPENEHADSVNSKTRYKRSQTAPCRLQALNANIRSITVILFCKKWLNIGEQNDFEGRAYTYEKGLQQRAAVFFFLLRRSGFSSALPADTGTFHSKFNWQIFVLPSFVPRFNNDMAVTVSQFVYFSRPVILEWIRYLRLLYYLRPYHRETPPCCMITSSQRPRGKAAILGSAGKR